MKKNAIILAAGKSNRFAPFTYEKPKGLFCVKGEILIERQIEQLISAGVDEIIIVIGYMKEKFFYLEQKYKEVKLIVNNTFASKGNIYSMYVAREYLKNTYICCADHYFIENPFVDNNSYNKSYRATTYYSKKFREFSIDYSDENVITGFYVGGSNKMAMVGHAYFNEEFSNRFKYYLESEINDFGVSNMFWEEFYAKHQKELTLYVKEYPNNKILEFENIEDLRQFDSEFLLNVDSEIIKNICNTLKCDRNDIIDIKVIQAGLTNVSFKFSVKSNQYVYRHPGGTAGKLIDRHTELVAQNVAKNLGIDTSVIYMDPTGWKISHYVQNIVDCDFLKNEEQLDIGMEYLRKFHSADIKDDIKEFDDVLEGKKLMGIASSTKGNLFLEFQEIIKKIECLKELVDNESKKYGFKKVLCHNDVYEPNYIATADKDLYLIDWEYAGLNDPANDIACIICRYDYSFETADYLLEKFYGRKLNKIEHRHCISYIALCAFYWFCWGLYKGSVGDDDGFFFLPSYRNLIKYIDVALNNYKEVE